MDPSLQYKMSGFFLFSFFKNQDMGSALCIMID